MQEALPTLTFLLSRWSAGERRAAEELMSRAFPRLRRLAGRLLAGERPDHTLQPTALVHEVYLALDRRQGIQNRRHFFGLAGSMMRALLIDEGRRRGSLKRGGGWRRELLDADQPETSCLAIEDLLALGQALDRLAEIAPQKALIVDQRFFAGLTVAESAANLGISERTVSREWRAARAWLHAELTREPAEALEE